MGKLPKRQPVNREPIDVEVGDFSHDRLYPDLNPEFFGGEPIVTEDEYYFNIAQDERVRQLEEDEQFAAIEAIEDSGMEY